MNRTIVRAFEALEYISTSEDGFTLKEITDKLDIPKSSAFNIVQTLLNLNLVAESRYNDKKYVLGAMTYSLGMRYLDKQDYLEACKTYLIPLADEVHRNCFIGVLDKDKVLYIFKHVGDGAKLATCDIGTRQDLYFTGLGKVLLAYSDPNKVNQIIKGITFVQKTPNTITNAPDLYAELERTRERGYAIDDREVELYMQCFAAPVFNANGECIAAISISDMYSEDADFEYLGQRIKEIGLKISEQLGYRPKNN